MFVKLERLKIIAFIIVGLILTIILSYLFQPVWYEWGNYARTEGFYARPENTIQVVFVGPSTIVNGIIPMEMYQDQGISAYNLGSEQQPMYSSYYWLEEAYRRNKETLKVVVLDPSMLRRNAESAFYSKAMDGMQLSSVKIRALIDASNKLDDIRAFLDPIYKYHSRWHELTRIDIDFGLRRTNEMMQGYNFTMDCYLSDGEFNKKSIPFLIPEKDIIKTELDQNSLYYLKKMVDFCNENDLNLVLAKMPTAYWGRPDYNAVYEIAARYSLDYLDFNEVNLYLDSEISLGADSVDGGHLNYYGARKISLWLAKYIISKFNIDDIRDDSKYIFMEKLASDYNEYVAKCEMIDTQNSIGDYLHTVMNINDCVSFIAVRGDGALALTEETREYFRELGLYKLATIAYRDSYIAIIKDGEVVLEELDSLKDRSIVDELVQIVNDIDNAELNKGDLMNGKLNQGKSLYLYTNGCINNMRYRLASGGASKGDLASCVIDGNEYSLNKNGINIITCSGNLKQVYGRVCFDTSNSEYRVSTAQFSNCKEISVQNESDILKPAAMYNRRVKNVIVAHQFATELRDDDLLVLLDYIISNDNYCAILAVMGDGSAALSDEAREWLKKNCLNSLSCIEYAEPYIGIIKGDSVVYEEKGGKSSRITHEEITFKIKSSGEENEGASIIIDDSEYTDKKRGVIVTVYDNVLESVLYSTTFDTNMVCQEIPR